ncbi:MAG TPA: thioesterase family protein [Dehalococcoidia bacterium]|jgi:acyl-CoA thioester hydrolase|nr:thioesterase family protein [Dehalococcoidia bacterium]
MSGRGIPANVSLVRVRMYHTDLVGGAFHGRYFDLFEEARTEAFRRAGFHWEMTHRQGIAFVVTRVACDFYRPTAMDDELAIAVFVTKLSRARCVVEYEMRRAGEEALLAHGRTDFAFWDVQRGRLVAVPESVREAVFRCEGMYRPAGRDAGERE